MLDHLVIGHQFHVYVSFPNGFFRFTLCQQTIRLSLKTPKIELLHLSSASVSFLSD